MKPNLDNLKQITLTDVENSLTLPKSWWAVISSLPLARRLILIIVRYTKLTPNQVTFISILLSMLSAALFYKAEFLYGAIFYWLSYVFDCVDGS
ncbi:MAG: CDP-alcohol phosphatidyltransferase family protein [Spirochaetota bacterium]|nr:CDP-alcohol phosphatidyltransferase family protein [Spirochaetota bacterium]